MGGARSHAMSTALVLLVGGILVGCFFSPSIGSGQVQCGAQGECPPGMTCNDDGMCYSPGAVPLKVDSGTCAPLHCYIGWCGPVTDDCGHSVDCGSCDPMNVS